jgi:Uncharacterized protein conserved in bacteria (DUF2237)
MLRDDRREGPRRPLPARNVLGEPLEICSFKPMTGFYRDGCCNTGREDVGRGGCFRAASGCRASPSLNGDPPLRLMAS